VGLDTFQTEDLVKGWLKGNRAGAEKSGVICIGPAGENQVTFAVIENDYWRSAGRTGVGAVLGSKKIKAIGFWGASKRQMAHPEAVKALARELAAVAKEDKGVAAYKSMGTSMMVDMMNHAGCFPTEFWKRGSAEHKEKINAAALHSRLDVTPSACFKCFMACGRKATVKEGRHQGLQVEGRNMKPFIPSADSAWWTASRKSPTSTTSATAWA
jgi:aldehyde:ferredoxin oxidoreductase